MPSGPQLSPPKQPRSKKTLERIVAAGVAILEEEGPSAVTVQAVVKRARTSVGSFYARFRGKDDLLAYLAEHVRESALAEWKAAAKGSRPAEAGLPEVIRTAVAHLFEVQLRWDAGVRAAAGLRERPADHRAFRWGVVEELAERLLERRHEMTHPSPEAAVRLGLCAVLGVIDHLRPEDTSAELDPDALRDECVTLLTAYLMGGVSDAGAQVDFFDVWS